MPYHVQESAKCPEGKPWACVNTVTGRIMGCHPDKSAAVAQMEALYLRVPDAATKKEPAPEGKKIAAPTFLPGAPL